jgi:hypothetical protein
MQLPTHLITAVMIDRLIEKSGLPKPARLAAVAGLCYLSHGILDKIAVATYHPPDPLPDRFWVIYHKKVLPVITWNVLGAYGPRHGFAMLFSALPDLDWVVRGWRRKNDRLFPWWDKPILNEGLHSFLNKVPVINQLNRLPNLRMERKGVLIELGLVAAVFLAIQCLGRKPSSSI